MYVLFTVGVGFLLAWRYGHSLTVWFDPNSPTDLLGGIPMFVLGVMLGQIMVLVLGPVAELFAIPLRLLGFFGGKGGSLWGTMFGRRLIGRVAHSSVWMLAVAIGWAPLAVPIALIVRFYDVPPPSTRAINVFYALTLGWAIWRSPRRVHDLKVSIGRKTRPLREFWHSRFFGFGGSARFPGLFEEWAHPWKAGDISLGASLYDPQWHVGIADDRHFLTIATSRSGKGRSGIIPNLLSWPGSALVIDPKGQNAAVTAEARRKMGQDVRIVDPFGVLRSVGLNDPVSRFNPLAELNPRDINIYENIDLIGDALVVPDPKGDNFWDGTSRGIINGLVAHAVTWPAVPAHHRNLTQVREWMTHDLPVNDLLNNHLAGGIPRALGGQLGKLSDTALRDTLGTALNHIKWLNSPAMQQCLAVSDFSLRDLKRRPTTLYLVIPPDYLETHGRFLRLFVNMAVSAAVRDPLKAEHDLLYVLDEFYALGRMNRLMAASSNLGGYGVKLWPIIQNISQLQELYPKNWETFMGNAGLWQVFAVNDQSTAQYLSERLGMHVRWRKLKSPEGSEWLPQNPTFLRTSVEVAQETDRDSGRQFIYREGGDCLFLRRRPYDAVFKPGEYRPDPYQTRGARRPVGDDDLSGTDVVPDF